MLGDISGLENIYIVCCYTDIRKSIDGLCAIIEDQLKMYPSSRILPFLRKNTGQTQSTVPGAGWFRADL